MQVGVQPQLYADNLKCVSRDPELLLGAARFTTGYVRLVGQEPAPSECVLMNTSRAVISRLVLVFALPLDFHGRLRVLCSMFIPGALHGVEASLLAGTSLRKLRAAFFGVAWSRRQPFASIGAVTLTMFGRDIKRVWNGFLLGQVRGQDVPCRFCRGRDHDGHLFWDCPFPPLVEIREHPEFHDLMRLDKANWPRCLLWHGWLPMLSGINGVPLGLSPLLKELVIFLSVLLGGILPVSFLSGGCLLVLMLRVRLEGLLRNLMFGLMVVWLMTGRLALLLLLCALQRGSVGFGLVGGGVIGMMMLVMVLWVLPVVVSALFLVLCRLLKGLSFGVLFLHFSPVMVFILELIIWEAKHISLLSRTWEEKGRCWLPTVSNLGAF